MAHAVRQAQGGKRKRVIERSPCGPARRGPSWPRHDERRRGRRRGCRRIATLASRPDAAKRSTIMPSIASSPPCRWSAPVGVDDDPVGRIGSHDWGEPQCPDGKTVERVGVNRPGRRRISARPGYEGLSLRRRHADRPTGALSQFVNSHHHRRSHRVRRERVGRQPVARRSGDLRRSRSVGHRGR